MLFRTGAQNNTGRLQQSAVGLAAGQGGRRAGPEYPLEDVPGRRANGGPGCGHAAAVFGRSYVLVKPYVKDYVLSPLGYPLLNKVSIQK